jgi:hypothetical protein
VLGPAPAAPAARGVDRPPAEQRADDGGVVELVPGTHLPGAGLARVHERRDLRAGETSQGVLVLGPQGAQLGRTQLELAEHAPWIALQLLAKIRIRVQPFQNSAQRFLRHRRLQSLIYGHTGSAALPSALPSA